MLLSFWKQSVTEQHSSIKLLLVFSQGCVIQAYKSFLVHWLSVLYSICNCKDLTMLSFSYPKYPTEIMKYGSFKLWKAAQGSKTMQDVTEGLQFFLIVLVKCISAQHFCVEFSSGNNVYTLQKDDERIIGRNLFLMTLNNNWYKCSLVKLLNKIYSDT